MPELIYVVGFHRGGTHQFAEWKAKETGLFYVDEGKIEWNDLEAAVKLTQKRMKRYDIETNKYYWIDIPKAAENGMVVQCPGLAHEAEALSKVGKVYWISRNPLHIVTSMKNANIGVMAWDIMKDFKKKWPDDPIWSLLTFYNGTEDAYSNFVGYYTILIKVKEYFYEKYLKPFAEKVVTEEQPYYDLFGTVTVIKPLLEREVNLFNKYSQMWEEVHGSLGTH